MQRKRKNQKTIDNVVRNGVDGEGDVLDVKTTSANRIYAKNIFVVYASSDFATKYVVTYGSFSYLII